MEFANRYKALNDAQREAVDTIDGPVMVVAGPGTGKTELLSVRVANILRSTDALPSNILCLTFTESGAFAMRERLADLIGADAYKVAIHTFHSFGSEIINSQSEYFYNGADFRPADELSAYEVLREIFEKLPHSNPLSSTMNGEYTYLRDVQRALSDLKKSGLTSDELLAIVDRNEAFVDWLQPKLNAVLADRLSKRSIPAINDLIDEVASYSEDDYQLITYEPLYRQFHDSLSTARDDAVEQASTKPLSAWKREWCEKKADGELTLRDAKRSKLMRAVAGIYYDYLLSMQQRGLYDFDDMILRVVHALEVFEELRLNLQEQYQYILIDEFQDTNDAQMRLIWNLSNNPVSGGRPNVMVVGDDDQAIYRFQGANISNILDFHSLYDGVATVTLRENYRSARAILDTARQTITQADERLERTLENVDKTLNDNYRPQDVTVSYNSYENQSAEFSALAATLANALSKQPEATRAVIARRHSDLQSLVPYLQARGVAFQYDQQQDALTSPPVRLLVLLAEVVDLLAKQRFDDANGLLPELLAHPSWGISTEQLWELSLKAYRDRRMWLELMLHDEGELREIAEWLVVTAHQSLHEPLEYLLDQLIGIDDELSPETSDGEAGEAEKVEEVDYISPLKQYFFPDEILRDQPAEYVSYLASLSALRHKLREYRPNTVLKLSDFVTFVDMHRTLGISINASIDVVPDEPHVVLLSAHKSKGLEFDDVYIIGASDNVWGETVRRRSHLISYPHNLSIGTGGDSSDERIRLLFVALTRAKSTLSLSYHTQADNGKQLLPVGYLSHQQVQESTADTDDIASAEIAWHDRLTRPLTVKLEDLLAETLSRYKLSATHLGNYLDISRGGPETFLLHNLLRFPQAMSPSAAYGSAIHATLQKAHTALRSNGKKRPVEDLLADFDSELQSHQLSSTDYEYFAKRGADVLSAFFAARYDSFSTTQQVERSFATETVTLGDARLTGALDLIDIDEEAKTIVVTDYKTGRAVQNWQGTTPYEKIKMHHYRQQLMFYKLLVEHSRQFSGYTVTRGIIEFVEPDRDGRLQRVELDYDEAELEQFTTLIQAVWARIQARDFTLPTEFSDDLKGIEAFEEKLLAEY